MPDQPKFPSWVRTAHTQQLINTLNTATYTEIPPGSSDDSDTKKFLSMLDEAGLEFLCHVSYYEGYIPVVVMIPGQRRPGSPPLPAHLKVALSDEDKAEAVKLSQKFGVDPAGVQPNQAYTRNAVRLEWELAKTVAARVNDYYGIVQAGTPNPGKVAGTLALGFVSTNLGFVSSYLGDSGSPLAPMLVNCLAFGINVATLPSTPALPALGVIGAIAALESLASCAKPIEQVLGNLRISLNELSRLRQMLETIPRERQGDRFSREGNKVEVKQGNQTVDGFQASNPRAETVDIKERPSGKPDGKCVFLREFNSERCKFSEKTADGGEKPVGESRRDLDTGDVEFIPSKPN